MNKHNFVCSSFSHIGGDVHTIRRIIMHPEYIHDTLNADVAVVRLNNPAVFSSRVKVARIPGPNYNIGDGANVTYVGWGRLHVHINSALTYCDTIINSIW